MLRIEAVPVDVEDREVIPVASMAKEAAYFAGHLEMDSTPSHQHELHSLFDAFRDSLLR